jgi:hypothetical protein
MRAPFAFIKKAGSAPTITSLNYSQGDVAGGGQSIIATGTNLLGATSASFGGTAATVTGSTSTTATITLPAKAAGVTTVTVTTPSGTSGTLAFEFWSPASLALSLWCRGSYTGAPWAGNASAGASTGRTLATDGADPTTGTAVGGFTPASSNGTKKLKSSVTLSTLLPGAGYEIFALFKATSAAAPTAAPYTDPQIVGENTDGDVGIAFTTSGVSAFHFDGGGYQATTPIARATGLWTLANAFYNGTQISCALNGGTPQTVTAASMSGPGVAAATFGVFEQYLAPSFAGDVMELACMATNTTAGNRTKFRLYCNQRYGVSV